MVNSKNNSLLKTLSAQKVFLIMALPFIIHLIVLRYIPILGNIMAFQDFKVTKGWSGSEWVGFKHFKAIFADRVFYEVLRNTLVMAVMKLITGTFGALILAILLNETKNKLFKTSVQTITTLPHFISWTVVASLVIETLSPSTGIINQIMTFFNPEHEPILFMGEPKLFYWISTWSNLWKTLGWSAIIYLAAMTGIDQQLYEAAEIDGANRMQRIWHVTIPGIKSTIIILLVISIGYMMSGGFEQQFLLRNSLNASHARVFELFELEFGFQQNNYSFGTAAAVFKSVVSFILITIANFVAKRLGENSLF